MEIKKPTTLDEQVVLLEKKNIFIEDKSTPTTKYDKQLFL